METENPSEARPSLTELRHVVEDTFKAAGYVSSPLPSPASQVAVDSVYSGNGMVWAVVYVSSVSQLQSEWSDSNPHIRHVAELLARIAEPDAKWNLVLLAVITTKLTEDDIPAVTRFQEEPSYFARFVVSVGAEDAPGLLRNDISFLLLDWIGGGVRQPRQLQSARDEISALAGDVGTELGISLLENVRRELQSGQADADSLATAITTDLEGTPGQ